MQRVCTLENELDRCFIFVHIIILQLWKVFCHTRGTLINPQLYESVSFSHTMFVHSLECISIILCNLQRKSLIPSTCKLYSDLIWKIYFLIPTLLSVKLKIYIYLKVYYFIMKNIYFEKALLMCHLLRGYSVVAADCEVTCRSVKAGWIVHYELEDKYINVWN